MKHKLMVFDWNGTVLSDTVPAWKASNICLEHYGSKPISLQRFRETFHFPVIHFYKLNGVSVDEVLATKDVGNTVFQSAYDRLSAGTRTRTGARDLLESLNDAGVTCIILSNYMTDKIKAHLNRLGLERYFQYVSAHDCDGTTILESTTKTGRLSDYMVKRNFRPANTIIIGDSMEEPEIARHLGLTSISITGGVVSKSRLKKAGPDYIVDSLKSAKTVVNDKWGLNL